MQTLHEQEPTRTVVPPSNETPLSEEAVVREHTTLPKTGKRIVSKSRYVANVVKKTALSFHGLNLYLTGMLGLAACLVMLLFICSDRQLWQPFVFAITGLLAFVSVKMFVGGRRALNKGVTLDIGVPLTRANTADLPALDSLVRASSEPQQAQEGVLLRAAAAGQETPSEQLVRASVGQE